MTPSSYSDVFVPMGLRQSIDGQKYGGKGMIESATCLSHTRGDSNRKLGCRIDFRKVKLVFEPG